VAVLCDGHIRSYVLRERLRRIKHAIGLDIGTIEAALTAAGITAAQVDHVAISSTQRMELIIDDPARFSISMTAHPGSVGRAPLAEQLAAQGVDARSILNHSVLPILYEPRFRHTYQYACYRHYFPEHEKLSRHQITAFGWTDIHVSPASWRGTTLLDVGGFDPTPTLNSDTLRLGFHLPVSVMLEGRSVPGYFINHHAAHAASCFFASGFDRAAILTHDGFSTGSATLTGLYFLGEGNRILPLAPHFLEIGALYDLVSVHLRLGDVGPAGKLMGLAAWGKPRFFDRSFVGNFYDWQRAGIFADRWISHCMDQARATGYDLSPLAQRDQMTAPINVDLAASTQLLFEEIMLAAVKSLSQIVGRSGRPTNNLCLTGGTALNCPANARIWREGQFPNVYVEPGCDDSGIAGGAAKFLYHNVFDQPLPPRDGAVHASPFVGVEISSSQIEAALKEAGDSIKIERVEDAAARAAADLADDKIIAWFEGSSEIGPRALGHRSILADPRKAENWQRVNQLKKREAWRPLAPAVLESHAAEWFSGTPLPSPYMLFTGKAIREGIPAVTHIDGSARLQTVGPDCGEFFRVLTHFHKLTGIPVLLNTSFNGPGEPIVESPGDAVRFLRTTGLDALYMGGCRLTR
jgi:carbamoyltransferase